MKCQGSRQSCARGNCQLQCPSPNDPEKCAQRCKINRDKCVTKDLVISTKLFRTVRDKCDNLENGVCQQNCVEGGCLMECFKLEDYHSCTQMCTGNTNTNSNSKAFLGSFALETS